MTTAGPDLDALRQRLAHRYQIGRQLGRGGMGAVYLARDLQLDRPLAIKVLPAEFASQPALRERFLRETRTAAGFSHPNIVPVFAVEDHHDVLAMAMGFVEGESLAERVTRAGPLSVKETVRLLQDVGYALAYAHGRGVVHRDIKPDNIMLERATGRALVMDFGISRTINTGPAQQAGLTRVGEVIGTPEFMSPEQASGDDVDGRSDLYSLGLVAWYAVTGALAITGESTQKILVKQLTEIVPPVLSARRDLPEPLAEAIDRLVKKDPADRFQTAEALVDAIDAAQLAAPPVPLAVRLFQQNGQVYIGNALLVAAFLVYKVVNSEPRATLDRLTAISVGFALEFVLLMTIARQARNLRKLGFDHHALQKGFAGVARKRRFRHIAVLPLILLGIYDVSLGYAKRVEVSEGYYSMSRVGATVLITGICTIVVGILILVLDPYRRPIMQRLANAFWGGPIGALLVGQSKGSVASTGTTKPVAMGVPAAPVGRPGSPVVSDDRLTRIERRLDALERK
jgi:serine/threonine protein kinase